MNNIDTYDLHLVLRDEKALVLNTLMKQSWKNILRSRAGTFGSKMEAL